MLTGRELGLFVALGMATVFAAACSNESTGDYEYNPGGSGGAPPGGGVGDACSTPRPCRPGLACDPGSNTCQPGHNLPQDARCTIAAECQNGLQCLAGTCQPGGDGLEGDGCSSDEACVSGMRCTVVGLSLQCAPEGTGDVGDACVSGADCFAGLACANETCVLAPPGIPTFGGLPWQGVSCEKVSEVDVRPYFEVTGASGAQEGDFFRLPFPNDVRRTPSGLDLTGFPTPGAGVLGVDVLARYVDAAGADRGWGANTTVLFRFSGPIDLDSMQTEGSVNWVDITPGADGANPGLHWHYSSGHNNYVCDNWVAVRRPRGAPMIPGHTYAVWLSTSVLAKGGARMTRPVNLGALLGASAPPDPKLQAVHASYQLFRDYITQKAISDTILNATVFTVADLHNPMQDLATAVAAAPTPVARSWVKCGAGVASPCPQVDGDRGCGGGSSAYDEYHALISLPIFQTGSAPYLEPADGGGIDASAPVRTEEVCMALTVPKTTMPANGWPLVVFAHGTGGSFRSHVRDEVAGVLANAGTPSAPLDMAVLGIDQVQHGPRRGSSTASPNNLFFNFLNPQAARGNPLQGAADQLALARFAAGLDVAASETGGAAIRVDPAAIVFFGHSQGATHGSLALPYSSVYRAAVFSGNGASLMHALLSKTSPVNVAAAVPLVLGDTTNGALSDGEFHPALSLLQQWIDPADPLSYARSAGREPPTGQASKHVFQTYGLGDTFSPPVTLAAYALAGGFGLASHDASVTDADEIGSLAPQAVPFAGNLSLTDGSTLTLAVRQYAPPSGRDGHFVVFDVATARADAARFLAMAARGEVPQVGP